MTDLKNNLEEVWREEVKVWINHNLSKTQSILIHDLCERAYLEARKKAQEDIEFWKNEYVSHSETMCRCQEELQKTRERLEKAESILKVSVDINISGWQTYRMANQYFKDKDKQGE